jgi:hypothetical protein
VNDRRADVAAEQRCLPRIVCGDIRRPSRDGAIVVVIGADRHVAYSENAFNAKAQRCKGAKFLLVMGVHPHEQLTRQQHRQCFVVHEVGALRHLGALSAYSASARRASKTK